MRLLDEAEKNHADSEDFLSQLFDDEDSESDNDDKEVPAATAAGPTRGGLGLLAGVEGVPWLRSNCTQTQPSVMSPP